MSELRDVLVSIANHTDVENREHYRNPSIGRGELMMKGMSVPKTIWILNSDPQQTWGVNRDITGAAVSTFHTGKKDSYAETDSVAVPKNREFARILLQNYEGHHTCKFMNGQVKDFLIRNSAHYTNTGSSVININVGVAGMSSWSIFQNLRQAAEALNRLDEGIRQSRQKEEEAKRKAEELRRKKQEEEARKAEEEARKLQEEIKAAQEQRDAILTQASKAAEFIRKQVYIYIHIHTHINIQYFCFSF